MEGPAIKLFEDCFTLRFSRGELTVEESLVRQEHLVDLRDANGSKKTAVLRIECRTGEADERVARHIAQISAKRPLLPGEDLPVSIWEEDAYPELDFGRPVALVLAYALHGVEVELSIECEGEVTRLPTTPKSWFMIGHYACDIRCRWFPDPVLKGLAEAVWVQGRNEEGGGWAYNDYLPDPFHSSDTFLVDPNSYLMSTTMWGSDFVLELGREAYADGSFFMVSCEGEDGPEPQRCGFSASVFQADCEAETWLVLDVFGTVALTTLDRNFERARHDLTDKTEVRHLDGDEEAPLHVWIRRHSSPDALPPIGFTDPPDPDTKAGDLRRVTIGRGVAEAVVGQLGMTSGAHLKGPTQIGQFLYGLTEKAQALEPPSVAAVRMVKPKSGGERRPERTDIEIALPAEVAELAQAEATRQDRSLSWVLTTAFKVASRADELAFDLDAPGEREQMQRVSLPSAYLEALEVMAKEADTDTGLVLAAAYKAAEETLARLPSAI